MKHALWLVTLLCLASVYGSADSITPHVVPLPVVSPDLSKTTVHPGGVFAVSINVGGVTNLAGFQFSFSFNPNVLSATGVAAGSFLSGGTFSAGAINNTAGTIGLTTGSAGTAVGGSGTLAIIYFTALAPGASALDLSNVTLLNASGAPINFVISNGSITVTPVTAVPEPATLSLFLLGAGPLVRRRLLRKAKLDR